MPKLGSKYLPGPAETKNNLQFKIAPNIGEYLEWHSLLKKKLVTRLLLELVYLGSIIE